MPKVNNKKVFVAMSGGVDSSVAALLLRDQGYKLTGVFMRCYNVDGCAERDAADARRVAAYLGIPFYVWDFEEEYRKRVVEYLIEGYASGITPNPDVMCNKEIKFGLFLEKALSFGTDYIATGHYVRLQPQTYKLFTARDRTKDQSYFLWTLTPDQLKYCLFPLGDYLKSEVREIARKAGLPTAEKKDSQGICFLGKVTLVDFLKDYIPPKRGPVFTTAGKRVGEHDGVHFYTVGQRHLGVGGLERPHYVVEKDVVTNTVFIAEEGNPALYKQKIKLTDVNFLQPITSDELPMTLYVRVRYRQPLAKAELFPYHSSIISHQLIFAEAQKSVAAGQSAVFYSEEKKTPPAGRQVLGGGVII